MAFRLPTLTMAVCVAFCVPQLASTAQQPITDTSPPIAQARIGDDSANPLRHQSVNATNRSPQPSVVALSNPPSSSANLENSIPAAVRQAIFPNRQHDQQPAVQPVAHVQPINRGESTRRADAVKQLHPSLYRESVKPRESVHHDESNNGSDFQEQFEPQPVEMTAGVSRLPKPETTPTPAADDKQSQTVASLIANRSGSTKSSTDKGFGRDLLEESVSEESSPPIQALLQNIAGSTCLVLILGVGFIVVAKRVMKGKQTAAGEKTEELKIHVVANLRLAPKSNLHLVEVGKQRVLVASDSTGIKSVVSLTDSFANSLDSFHETMPAEELTSTDDSPQDSATYEKPRSASQANAEIEAEMQRKLSEVLGGQAFKDVFYQSTRAVA